MITRHKLHFADSRKLSSIPNESIDLIVTSPPYPMIEMWDDTYATMNPQIACLLEKNKGQEAFNLMHAELDKVWAECFRVLKPGGFASINIGDAVRTLAGNFQLYSNHSQIITSMSTIGFTALPDILWRKQANTPNKFLGSGMLPAGAYVTYEHEYILIFRKGSKRQFRGEDKARRRQSAFFWEERNIWFSDVWTDLKGCAQRVIDENTRPRSGAFPFELPYRLISMYSLQEDTVLDPFLGTGTTTAACIATGRNSVGVEVDESLRNTIYANIENAVELGGERAYSRLQQHQEFVERRQQSGYVFKHSNDHYGFAVMTSQETDLRLYVPYRVTQTKQGEFVVEHGLAVLDRAQEDKMVKDAGVA